MIENISTLSHTKELRLAKRVFTHNFMMWQLIPLLTTLQHVLFSSLAQRTVSRTQHALSRSLTQHTQSRTQHAVSRTPHALYLKHNTLSFFFLQSTYSISNTTRSLPVAHATHSISKTNLILFKGLWVWWTEGEKNTKPRRLPPRLLLQKQMVKRPCHQVLLQKITEQVSCWNIRTIFNLF